MCMTFCFDTSIISVSCSFFCLFASWFGRSFVLVSASFGNGCFSFLLGSSCELASVSEIDLERFLDSFAVYGLYGSVFILSPSGVLLPFLE